MAESLKGEGGTDDFENCFGSKSIEIQAKHLVYITFAAKKITL